MYTVGSPDPNSKGGDQLPDFVWRNVPGTFLPDPYPLLPRETSNSKILKHAPRIILTNGDQG